MEVANTFFQDSTRRFLVRAKDHLNTIYGSSIYLGFETTYIVPLHWQTNCINLNKLNTLKHGKSAEIMKTWFSMKDKTRIYFFKELKLFFSIGFFQSVAL